MISNTCPIFRPENEAALHHLLNKVAANWHVIALPDPERLQGLMHDNTWRVYGEWLTQAYKTTVNRPRRWIGPSDCQSCDPERLAEYCALPVLILVENVASDGEFLKLITAKLRPALGRRFSGTYPQVQLTQAGGITELPKETLRLGGRYAAARPAVDLPSRFIVIADSDGHVPGDQSADARKVAEVAQRIGVSYHVLHKRSIENYIPDPALRAYADTRKDRKAAAELVSSLPRHARDHYPMKSGLSEHDLVEGSSIYPPHLPLSIGLGDFVVDLLTHFGHSVYAGDLLDRDGEGELNGLLDLVEENI